MQLYSGLGSFSFNFNLHFLLHFLLHSPLISPPSLSLFLCSSAVRSTVNARFPHSQQPSISQASSRSAPHCATHLSLLTSLLTSLLRSTPVSHFPLLVFFIFGVVYLEFLFWFCSDCRFFLLASADVFN